MNFEEALFASQVGSEEQVRKGLSRFAAKVKNFRESLRTPSKPFPAPLKPFRTSTSEPRAEAKTQDTMPERRNNPCHDCGR